MSSTRVIRPSSFKIDTVIKPNRPTMLPTPAKLRADTGVFQDIGAKLVRPKSRKEQSWLARTKGLRTTAGLEQQLIKEEGIKIRIGDKTLQEFLQVEVPDTRKQEYIKDDGSVGVRLIPVLDSLGNPVMVKKKLSIPGSIEHFQKPIKEKMSDIEQLLKDTRIDTGDKILAMSLLVHDIMTTLRDTGLSTREAEKTIKEIQQWTKLLPLPNTAEKWGLPELERLEDKRFADPAYVRDHLSILETQLTMIASKRGFPEGLNVIKDEEGKLYPLSELSDMPDGFVFDLDTSTFIDRREPLVEEGKHDVPLLEGKEEKEEKIAPIIEEEELPPLEVDPLNSLFDRGLRNLPIKMPRISFNVLKDFLGRRRAQVTREVDAQRQVG